MLKVTKAIIAYTKLTDKPIPQIIVFFITDTKDKSLYSIEVNSITTVDVYEKPNSILHICTIFDEPTGADTRIVTSFDGESYNTEFEGTVYDFPGQYALDSHMDMIKFTAGILIGQDLAYKAYKGRDLYQFREGSATSWKEMFNDFIRSRYTFKIFENELEVKRLYRLPKSYTPIIEDEV